MTNASGHEPDPGRALCSQISERLRLFLTVVESCVAQLDDSQVWARADEGENAVANLMLHLAGQLRQWMVAGLGGGAPFARDRAAEFSARGGRSKDEVLRVFRDAVLESCAVIDRLPSSAITETRRIQDIERPVACILVLSVSHVGIHVGQIQFITRTLLRTGYKETWANPR